MGGIAYGGRFALIVIPLLQERPGSVKSVRSCFSSAACRGAGMIFPPSLLCDTLERKGKRRMSDVSRKLYRLLNRVSRRERLF